MNHPIDDTVGDARGLAWAIRIGDARYAVAQAEQLRVNAQVFLDRVLVDGMDAQPSRGCLRSWVTLMAGH